MVNNLKISVNPFKINININNLNILVHAIIKLKFLNKCLLNPYLFFFCLLRLLIKVLIIGGAIIAYIIKANTNIDIEELFIYV